MTKTAKAEAVSVLNTSGLAPVEFKVLVLPEEKEEKTAGGIYLPDQALERERMAAESGLIVAIGGRAFEDFGEPKPQVGDRIVFGRYAGQTFKGSDEREYRVLNDKDIGLICR